MARGCFGGCHLKTSTSPLHHISHLVGSGTRWLCVVCLQAGCGAGGYEWSLGEIPFAGIGFDNGDACVVTFPPLEATSRYFLLTIPSALLGETLTLLGSGGATSLVTSLEVLLLGLFGVRGCCCRCEGEPIAGGKASQGELVRLVFWLYSGPS
jgi:hypothetical protein